jgi:hypothetical protein
MIKKLEILKENVLVPIEISTAFYRNLQECSTALLNNFKDPKEALLNIENSTKDINIKLSLEEFQLAVFMNIIHEVETVARKNPERYIELKEFTVED